MTDVAREAGVSRQLVSLVIRDVGYVAPEKRALVLDAAERLGYRRNNLAASLAGRRTYSIGLAVLDIHNQVYADFTDGVADVVEPAGYQLLLATGPRRDERGVTGLESLVGLRVDGILIATHVAGSDDLGRVLAGTPAVTLGEATGLPHVDAVHGDDFAGARAATDHLLSQGHRDIAFLTGPETRQGAARAAGYRAAMEAAGHPARFEQADATESGGTKALLAMRRADRLPTAVVCYNDAAAFGVLACAHRERIRVPEDLAVVGYDNTRAAGYPGVGLTSVDQHARTIASQAATLLLERIDDPDRPAVVETVTPRLVVRTSSSRFLVPAS
ncbi:LacI family DNA-binding transcriptional regulator [Microbacterium atlanticum]|uniref:LacI family DNA-binding transcriptional regulator n=1 Tax=Microbacterium atlanticum TaxID=2782168 RepID=UPI0018875FE1|nr:LacI family DNA-binding transcriptional regulator [Microbacterium atlanticum]